MAESKQRVQRTGVFLAFASMLAMLAVAFALLSISVRRQQGAIADILVQCERSSELERLEHTVILRLAAQLDEVRVEVAHLKSKDSFRHDAKLHREDSVLEPTEMAVGRLSRQVTELPTRLETRTQSQLKDLQQQLSSFTEFGHSQAEVGNLSTCDGTYGMPLLEKDSEFVIANLRIERTSITEPAPVGLQLGACDFGAGRHSPVLTDVGVLRLDQHAINTVERDLSKSDSHHEIVNAPQVPCHEAKVAKFHRGIQLKPSRGQLVEGCADTLTISCSRHVRKQITEVPQAISIEAVRGALEPILDTVSAREGAMSAPVPSGADQRVTELSWRGWPSDVRFHDEAWLARQLGSPPPREGGLVKQLGSRGLVREAAWMSDRPHLGVSDSLHGAARLARSIGPSQPSRFALSWAPS